MPQLHFVVPLRTSTTTTDASEMRGSTNGDSGDAARASADITPTPAFLFLLLTEKEIIASPEYRDPQ
jgi:hypothetical protein